MAASIVKKNGVFGGGRSSAGKQTATIVVTNPCYGKLCQDFFKHLSNAARSKLNLRTFSSWSEVKDPRNFPQTMPTTFISRLADLPEQTTKRAREAQKTRYLLFLEEMPVEALSSRLTRLAIRDPRRLHIARQRDSGSISRILHRLIRAMARQQNANFILDAWIEDKDIVLLSPSFERLSVPLEKLVRFIGEDPKEIETFEIDEDGSFLFWPHADIHLGWEQMQQVMDPAAALAAQKKTEQFNRDYGAAIRGLREERGLRQADIVGVTERHLRRIEHGEQAVTSTNLKALAKAHGMRIDTYLKALAGRI